MTWQRRHVVRVVIKEALHEEPVKMVMIVMVTQKAFTIQSQRIKTTALAKRARKAVVFCCHKAITNMAV